MKLPSICLAVILLAACQEKTAQKKSNEQEDKIVKNSEQEHIEDSVTIGISSQELVNGNRVESETPFLDYFDVHKDPVVKVKVEPSKKRVVKIQNGGEITIPANCFVDRSGNPIAEPVELVYDEIRTPAEIIFTDVDMKYDSAGVSYDFQTAGMFDISANANGEDVFIAEGKYIDIKYLDSGKDKDFNFYRYDRETENWTYQNVSRVELEEPKVESSSNADATADGPDKWVSGPIADKYNIPKPLAEKFKDRKVFDLNYPIVWRGSDEVLSCVMWQYAGRGKKQNPMLKEDFFTTEWKSVKLNKLAGKVARYRAKFTAGSKSFVTVLQPVAEGAFKEEYERIRLAAIEKVKKIQAEKEAKEAKIATSGKKRKVRKNRIAKFGLFNYDRMYKQPGFEQFVGNFKFSDDSDERNAYVFLITGDDDVVIRYPSSDFKKMAYCEAEDYKMVAVLPNKKIAVLNNTEFKKAVSQRRGKNVFFKLKVFEKVIAKPDDLQNLLASI